MSPREFLRPDKKLALLFLVMAVLAVVALGSGYRLVPCQLTPLTAPEHAQAVDSTCSLSMLMGNLVGSRAGLTPLSYIVLLLLVVAVPYLIACLVRAVALRGA
jgi:hypothetical protein